MLTPSIASLCFLMAGMPKTPAKDDRDQRRTDQDHEQLQSERHWRELERLPKERSGAVNGTTAVLATNVTSTRVASSPFKAARAGEAIIGEAACSIRAKNRSGDRSPSPIATQTPPQIIGTNSVVYTVAAITIPGRRSSRRISAPSTRMNETQSRRNTASATNGFNISPTGGAAIPIKTSAATARVPWRPSHARAFKGIAAKPRRSGVNWILRSGTATTIHHWRAQ